MPHSRGHRGIPTRLSTIALKGAILSSLPTSCLKGASNDDNIGRDDGAPH